MQAVYSSVEDEYKHIRGGVALLDCEDYLKWEISGPPALEAVNRLHLSDISRLPVGRLTSSYMLNADGRALADSYVWNQGDRYLVFAETAEPDTARELVRSECAGAACAVQDISDSVGLISIDGPFSWELLKEVVGVRILGLRYLDVLPDQSIGKVTVDVLRSGKTGEYGYLLKCQKRDSEALWNHLLESGKRFDITPCGTSAMNVCRLENRFVNMGGEGRHAGNVLELNCRVTVSRDKGDYVGRAAVEQAIADGISKRLVGIRYAEGRATTATQPGADIQCDGERIGFVAAAQHSFTLGADIGIAFIDTRYAYAGCDFEAVGTDGRRAVKTVSAPFIMNRSLLIRPQEDSYGGFN